MSDPRRELFGHANFRWLLGGGLLSMLGDQFTLLALPWLVMSLSNDPLVLGTVLALGSLPRALFILVGGALVDRHSPKKVLLLTKWINFGLLALLAGLTAHGGLTLPLVYALTLAIGLATAFSYPAGSAIVPQAVPAALIQPANGVLMGARQLVLLLGPVLAGLLVTGGAGPALQRQGLALAFGFDAVSFAISAWTLSRVRTAPREVQDAQPVLGAIAESMRACWQDRELRALFLYFAAIAFFVGGPIQVALPVLAAERLPGGAAALGVMLAAHGLGALAGMAVSGLRPQWRLGVCAAERGTRAGARGRTRQGAAEAWVGTHNEAATPHGPASRPGPSGWPWLRRMPRYSSLRAPARGLLAPCLRLSQGQRGRHALPRRLLATLGGTVLLIDAIAGGVFLLFGHVHAAWQGAALLLPLGALGGFVQVAVYSWLQRRIPPQMLGRAMALFMFIVMGLAPLASAAAGAALRVLDVTALFTAAALCLLAVVTLGALLTPIRQIAYLEAPPRPSTG